MSAIIAGCPGTTFVLLAVGPSQVLQWNLTIPALSGLTKKQQYLEIDGYGYYY